MLNFRVRYNWVFTVVVVSSSAVPTSTSQAAVTTDAQSNNCPAGCAGCWDGAYSVMLQGDPLHHQGYPGIPPGGGVQDQILIYLITYTSKFNLMTHSHLICIYIAYIIYIYIYKIIIKMQDNLFGLIVFLIWMGTEYSITPVLCF